MVFFLVLPGAAGADGLTDAEKLARVTDMYAGYRADFPAVVDISPRDAMALAASGGVVFVDTRTPEEMAVSTLPGAIGQDEFLQAPERYGSKIVVAYCTISYRSGLFADRMAEQGVSVRNLAGGILAWTLEGGDVVDATGPTRKLHVYGRDWDLAPSGYQTVVFGWWRRWF